MIRRAALLALLLAWTAEPSGDARLRLLPRVNSGDIVLRRGRTWVSEAVMAWDRESRYSHAGIVIHRGGLSFVVHSEPPGDGNPAGGVQETPLEAFASEREAAEIKVLRVRPGLEKEAQRAAEAARQFLGRPFDGALDLESDSSLYCTELVWRSYRAAGVDLLRGRFRRMNTLFADREVIRVSDLEASPDLEAVRPYGEKKE